ncbi:MAG: tetratricopeptide repeat protein [Gemmataceae bacterium]
MSFFAGEYEPGAQGPRAGPRGQPARGGETLALLAAVHLVKRDAKALQGVIDEVEKQSAKPAVFYYELAETIDRRKLYDDSEKYYKKAIDLEPRLPGPLAGLGMLYMRLGKEDEGRKILDKAFEADEYNLRIDNTLRVLKHLDTYETLKTDHFIIRYDKKNDTVLARVMAKYLEEMYDEFAKKFDYRPKEPILIEVFNRHDMFSGRIVQLPDLHTIGASTGKMFAMVSPHDTAKIIRQPFNWNRVLRHELVHVFNLEQTNFRIPHWYTEGLAVLLEGSKPPPRWNNLVAAKMKAKDLLNLDNVLLGFIRPRNPDQWDQAYMQSLLYVQYLDKKYGAKAIGELLAAYQSGMETDEALLKTFKVSKADFEKGYHAFLEERLPKDVVKAAPTFGSLRAVKEAYEKDPKNPDLAALLGERYYNLGNREEARKLADLALDLKKFHPLGVYVKALVLSDGGDMDTAFDLLSTAITEKASELKPLRLLGKLYFERKKYDDAARIYERCRELDPFDTSWLATLARVYKQGGKDDKLLGVLKELADATPDDLATRKQIAAMEQKAGNQAEVEKYARQALEIDVLDKAAQTLFLDALTAQGKNAEEKTWRKLLEP